MTSAGYEYFGIRTRAPCMLRVIDIVRRIADIDAAVLIAGETGTGKELIARALHAASRRRSKPLVAVNCAALPAGLVESELFGHERGAFTGAERAFGGRAEAAASGTLFLDEVNSLSLDAQGKLLRFLETGEISRVGRASSPVVNVRLVSAANVPLIEEVARGRMREDFYHRINVFTIDIPPLRERLEDLPLLVQQCIDEDPVAAHFGVSTVHPEVLTRLATYTWPGNVRELRNVVRRSLLFGAIDGVLQAVELPEADAKGGAPATAPWVGSREAYPPYRRDATHRASTVWFAAARASQGRFARRRVVQLVPCAHPLVESDTLSGQ